MTALRKSGSVVAYYWDGKIADPRDQAFADALASHRFRTIENAASEEVSFGWVTAADPTGDSFALEDLDGGDGTWLRFRVDTKKLPKEWLQQHVAVAEKARGRRLSARERRELKDDLAEKLLPRVLPKVAKFDALVFPDRRLVLLFASSKGARETFAKLFFESLGVPLERANPLQAGLRSAGLTGEAKSELERLEPTRWPKAERLVSRDPCAVAAAAASQESNHGE